jgi:hypothetical protein
VESVQKSFDSSAYDRHLIHVDIGPTKEWGHPVSIDEKEKFPAYYESIIGFSDKIDLCLVDGRFRLACFFQALLTLRSDAIIGIHDYRSRRHYHSVEKFARPIAENGDMTFFNRRLGIDLMSVKKALEKVAYSPA